MSSVLYLCSRGAGLGRPGGVQHRQVVGAGQGLLLCLKRGQLLAVSLQHVGQHAERAAGPVRLALVIRFAAAFDGEAVVAGQLRSRARARGGVGDLRGQREDVGDAVHEMLTQTFLPALLRSQQLL
jgi:hypothetical protein